MNKLQNSCLLSLSCIVIFLFTQNCRAQDSAAGPRVTRDLSVYRAEVKKDVHKKMKELRSVIPDLVYDLRYASLNNFMHRYMYPSNTRFTFLRASAAEKLKKVQEELALKDLGLKIFDAYRPYSVTVKFWELLKDERYVANPSKGSGHNRGTAVDLTLIDKKSGMELDMGTGFDNFSDSAHHSFLQLPSPVLERRQLLRSVMEKAGFKALETEWWHYSLPDAVNYEILDIPFRKLKKRS